MAVSQTYSGNGHEATIADPSNITQPECFELARCGVDAWNKWRDEFPGAPFRDVNVAYFVGVDFVDKSIDFSGFRFDGVDFSGARFGRSQKFRHCQFGRANFSGVTFESSAYFDGSVFSTSNFENASFKEVARFNSSLLGGTSRFRSCTFNDVVLFGGACITGDAHFDYSVFLKDAHFSGAIFLDEVSFNYCEYRGNAIFDGEPILKLRHVFRHPPYSNAWIEIEGRLEKYGGSPLQFRKLDFGGAVFEGRASFRGREFTSRTSFDIGRKLRETRTKLVEGKEVLEEIYALRPVEFAKPPEFFDSKLCQQVSFDHARFPSPTGEPEAARCYRVLKQAFAAHQATREEQRFFRLEMAEEAQMAWSMRGLLSAWWRGRGQRQRVELPPPRLLYRLYAALSNFGFSIARPLGLFFASLLVATGLYAWQADLTACWSASVSCTTTGPLIQFATASALPGFEKLAEPAGKLLFGKELEDLGVWTVLTLLLHKTVSLLALFLIGLALRNLFKMK